MQNGFKVVCILLSVWFVGLIADAVLANYTYSRNVESFWRLAVKASTIEKKSAYLDQYVEALQRVQLADSSALWLKTPDNSVEQNMVTLRSLQNRMHDIIKMNVSSFEYQQAMAQITGQEQDEAYNMLVVFERAWYLQHHFFLWTWMAAISFLGLAILALAAGLIGWADSY